MKNMWCLSFAILENHMTPLGMNEWLFKGISAIGNTELWKIYLYGMDITGRLPLFNQNFSIRKKGHTYLMLTASPAV